MCSCQHVRSELIVIIKRRVGHHVAIFTGKSWLMPAQSASNSLRAAPACAGEARLSKKACGLACISQSATVIVACSISNAEGLVRITTKPATATARCDPFELGGPEAGGDPALAL